MQLCKYTSKSTAIFMTNEIFNIFDAANLPSNKFQLDASSKTYFLILASTNFVL